MKNHQTGYYATVLNILFFISLLFLTISATAQISQKDQSAVFEEYAEEPDDPYIPVAREHRRTAPAYNINRYNFFSRQVNVSENGENILGDAANEPSIAVDPNDPNRIAIGWRQFDTISSNFRQAGYSYSTDGGQTWTFPGPIEPGVFRSDPVLDFDTDGTFYYNSLASSNGNYPCDVFQSDGNNGWDSGTSAQGGDKQWMVIDRTNGPGHGHIYSFWKRSFSVCAPGLFTRSTDAGESYEDCVDMPDNPIRGTLAIGPDGELYACGQMGGSFVVAKSSNAKDASQTISWDFSNMVNLGGPLGHSIGPNPSGMMGQVNIATDHSGGTSHGNVYLLCSVVPNATNDRLDVMFARSTDGGENWEAPTRINDDNDPNAYQWFGTMAVAPNGRIDVVWLDTRLDPGGVNSALYYSFSMDGGLSWSENEQLSELFNPHLGWPQQNKMGDYFEMISENEGAHLAWAATFNGEQDAYYGYISAPLVDVEEISGGTSAASLLQNYPNPFGPSTTIAYSIKKAGQVKVRVYDESGILVRQLLNEYKAQGKYSLIWDGENDQGHKLSNGLYFYQLLLDGKQVVSKRMLLMD